MLKQSSGIMSGKYQFKSEVNFVSCMEALRPGTQREALFMFELSRFSEGFHGLFQGLG